jgi:hypothetical protein
MSSLSSAFAIPSLYKSFRLALLVCATRPTTCLCWSGPQAILISFWAVSKSEASPPVIASHGYDEFYTQIFLPLGDLELCVASNVTASNIHDGNKPVTSVFELCNIIFEFRWRTKILFDFRIVIKLILHRSILKLKWPEQYLADLDWE